MLYFWHRTQSTLNCLLVTYCICVHRLMPNMFINMFMLSLNITYSLQWELLWVFLSIWCLRVLSWTCCYEINSSHVIISRKWESIAKIWRSTLMFGRFSLTEAVISLHKLISFSLQFLYKHILIMSDSDLELKKYSISKLTVIFKGLTWPIFEMFCRKCYRGWTEYKLGDARISHVFDNLIWI